MQGDYEELQQALKEQETLRLQLEVKLTALDTLYQDLKQQLAGTLQPGKNMTEETSA